MHTNQPSLAIIGQYAVVIHPSLSHLEDAGKEGEGEAVTSHQSSVISHKSSVISKSPISHQSP